MSDQENLLNSAEQSLSDARFLFEGERFNAAISRSYYAVFNGAKALLLEKGSSPKTHQGVSSELGRLFREELNSEITKTYSQIQTMREEADYGTGKDFDREEAEEAVEFAEEFLLKVEELVEDR